jgi:hypothetical protein
MRTSQDEAVVTEIHSGTKLFSINAPETTQVARLQNDAIAKMLSR